jgi:hypothetical protein
MLRHMRLYFFLCLFVKNYILCAVQIRSGDALTLGMFDVLEYRRDEKTAVLHIIFPLSSQHDNLQHIDHICHRDKSSPVLL